ncbi:MAG: hypothetical protein KatS3mg003_2036 [Candidatus Nitrosocaldaceae archaeon]|nr:MAG: hypothetical protein KatS3mg003_2036 [Candidatus Nitrosocaldaceae archaeon]
MYIYQVMGDPNSYKLVKYKIDKSTYETFLSSEALFRHYNASEIVLLCPLSLRDKKDAIKSLVSKELREYLRIKEIHSIGKYAKDYQSTPTNIAVQIFTDMLDKDRVLCDISTGHNIYTAAILEAARFYTSYKRINDLKFDSVYASYAIAEPIIRNVKKDNYTIFIEELLTATRFDLPYSIYNIKNHKIADYIENAPGDVKYRLHKKYEALDREIKAILCNLLLAFNAIKYNTPLVFNNQIIDLSKDIEIRDLIDFCNTILEYYEDHEKVVSLEFKRSIFNLYLALALYNCIKKFIINVDNLNDLKCFYNIYDKLGLALNKRFLERDIKEIEGCSSYISNKWTRYDEIYKECKENLKKRNTTENNKDKYSDSDIKRNFFAHSGFERTVFMVKMDGKIIKCKYDDDKINEIKKWLAKPE